MKGTEKKMKGNEKKMKRKSKKFRHSTGSIIITVITMQAQSTQTSTSEKIKQNDGISKF